MERPLYFAYGSNINLDQMRYRCPDASVYGQAVLDNYDLRFRGSGVATVEPKEGACIYGLLWELTDKCEASLDRYLKHNYGSVREIWRSCFFRRYHDKFLSGRTEKDLWRWARDP